MWRFLTLRPATGFSRFPVTARCSPRSGTEHEILKFVTGPYFTQYIRASRVRQMQPMVGAVSMALFCIAEMHGIYRGRNCCSSASCTAGEQAPPRKSHSCTLAADGDRFSGQISLHACPGMLHLTDMLWGRGCVGHMVIRPARRLLSGK